MTLTTLLLIACVGPLLGWRLAHLPGGLSRYLPALLPLGLFCALATLAPTIAAGQAVAHSWAWAPTLGAALSLRLDGFSLLFTLLITGIGTLVTIYATAYFSDAAPRERARFIFLIQAFMAAMVGTVLSDNLVAMFVFWEATSLLSFLLIGFEAHKTEARKAALQSLLITGGGGLALFGGILLIGMAAGTFSLSALMSQPATLLDSPWALPAAILLFVGAFTKSAQFPFHFWLPQAMAAPTPASAYLHSATMVKLGVYLLARFEVVYRDASWFGTTLVIVGSITMLVAALGAIRATGYKAVLAQSTVASLGILVMLIGLDSPESAIAVSGFIVAHAFYKAALFFCAGTAIHATHITELRKLGGLARFLPVTAAAIVLASLSMAGLPPFVGFIAKEYLFEAQLESSWSVLPVAVAVVVNGVMVATAGVVSLRPFFLSKGKVQHVDHGETPGLLVGPLTLGLLGVAAGLVPGFFSYYLIAPAATALAAAPIDISFSLWHGLTPMLALSALVVTLGALLAWKWDAFHHALNRMLILKRLDAARDYQHVLDAIVGTARWSTRQLQNGDIRRYTLLTCIALLFTIAWSLTRSSGLTAMTPGGDILPLPVILLAFALAGAVIAVRTHSLVKSLIGVGVVGYGSALLFLLHGAPDLALTQFAVETLVLVVLMAVLGRLPGTALATRTSTERRIDAMVALAFGLLIFAALASMLAEPFDTRLSDFFAASSYPDAHGQNVVNVIIVDYRALDTLGEIAVVAFATLGVWGLLRRRKTNKGRGTVTPMQHAKRGNA
ncbi:Na(+) H(+) antiporter subunit A [plant metagenome]